MRTLNMNTKGQKEEEYVIVDKIKNYSRIRDDSDSDATLDMLDDGSHVRATIAHTVSTVTQLAAVL